MTKIIFKLIEKFTNTILRKKCLKNKEGKLNGFPSLFLNENQP
jgi:hypothetical protein